MDAKENIVMLNPSCDCLGNTRCFLQLPQAIWNRRWTDIHSECSSFPCRRWFRYESQKERTYTLNGNNTFVSKQKGLYPGRGLKRGILRYNWRVRVCVCVGEWGVGWDNTPFTEFLYLMFQNEHKFETFHVSRTLFSYLVLEFPEVRKKERNWK